MAQSCTQCGRTALNSVRRSHSNIAIRNLQRVNLQRKTLDGKRGMFCTRCIRSADKAKAT